VTPRRIEVEIGELVLQGRRAGARESEAAIRRELEDVLRKRELKSANRNQCFVSHRAGRYEAVETGRAAASAIVKAISV
jgi:hypothetical protein